MKESNSDDQRALRHLPNDLLPPAHAERTALAALQREVREDLIKLTARRNETVKVFATGVEFIGKATKPADKTASSPAPAVVPPEVGDRI